MPSAGDYVRAGDTTRYFCKSTQGTQQSINSAVLTTLTFDDTDTVDNLGIHDPVTNNSRFTIGLKLGWWQITGTVIWNTAAAASQGRRSQLMLNGSGINGSFFIDPVVSLTGFSTTVSETLVQATLSTDYVELQGYQDSGSALTTRVSGAIRSQVLCVYIGTGT